MIFKKLVFDNYKTFYGIQEIDFYIPQDIRQKHEQNIILLGGLNGTGKTTILKAFLYILFGKRGMSETEYKRLSSNIINNTYFEEGGRSCSLSLFLETDSGEEWHLKLKWYFDNLKRVTTEERDLSIKPAGAKHAKHAKVTNIEAYNRFIDRIIPYYAAPFFIFDGEEIKEIILRQNQKEMKEAIHKITGMEGYHQLILDLRAVKRTIENNLGKSISHTKFVAIQKQFDEAKKAVLQHQEKLNKVQAEIRKYQEKVDIVKQEREKKLAANSMSREVILKKQVQLSTSLDLLKKEFNEYLKANIIQIILRDKIKDLKQILKIENEIARKEIIKESALIPYQSFINQLLSAPITPELTENQLQQLKDIGEQIWIKENNMNIESENSPIIHDINNSEYHYLMNLTIQDKHKAISYLNQIDNMQNKLQEIEIELRKAPESVNIEQENKKIDLLTQKLGEWGLQEKVITKKYRAANEEKTILLNKLTRLAGQENTVEDLQSQYNYITRTIKTIEQFVEQNTKMKANTIREEFSLMLETLFRKKEEFGKIEFDVETYSIRLYNDQMQEISIQDRSAGEMQMISSALIWALTKVSDLSLPMVIDTPLGRLDSYHRNHLLNYYYKELSEQVIILSTDTEISHEYVDIMQEHSYKQYMLDYNEQKKYTIVRDGYFEFVKG